MEFGVHLPLMDFGGQGVALPWSASSIAAVDHTCT